MNIALPNWLPLAKGNFGKEQGLIVLAGVVAAILFLQGVIPALERWRSEVTTRLNEQIATVEQLESELKTIGEDDPAKVRARIQREYESLLTQVTEQEKIVRELRGGLVNSDQITVLLARLLEQNQGVSLVSIENAGVTPVNSPTAVPTNPAPPATAPAGNATPPISVTPTPTVGPTLYRHGVRMLLKGDYRSLVRYLAHVEQLPWTIYWDEVELVVDKHPVVELAIEFHTLSEQQAWMEIT